MPLYVPKEFSFNARETFCPICRSITDQALMVGDTHIFECVHCGFIHLGSPNGGLCVKCQCNILKDKGVPLLEERFPAAEPCASCQQNLLKIQAVVTLGGLAWRCLDCGAIGAFDHNNPITAAFVERFPDRDRQWELDHNNCPACKNEKPNQPGEGV